MKINEYIIGFNNLQVILCFNLITSKMAFILSTYLLIITKFPNIDSGIKEDGQTML